MYMVVTHETEARPQRPQFMTSGSSTPVSIPHNY